MLKSQEMKLLVLWLLSRCSPLGRTECRPLVHRVPRGDRRQCGRQRRMAKGPPWYEGGRRGPGVRWQRHAVSAYLCAPKSGPRPEGVRACACLLETHPGFLRGGDVVRECAALGAPWPAVSQDRNRSVPQSFYLTCNSITRPRFLSLSNNDGISSLPGTSLFEGREG